MKPNSENERRERQDWAIVGIILLIGFLCVAVAGQWALRLSPSWELNTNMESNIDPNSKVDTGKPVSYFEPLDPAILTKPPWAVLFTPGAHFETKTPLPPPAKTSTALAKESAIPDTPVGSATIPVATNTVFVTNTVVPTNTFVWYPPPAATNTKKPKPKDTPTDTPIPSGDLQVTVDDGVPAYSAPGTLTYYINVINPSVSAANGIIVTDFFSSQIASVSWSCTAICASSGTGSINDTLNLPAGSTATYKVDVTISQYAVEALPNTASITIPAGFIDTNPGNNSATDTDAGPAAGGGLVTIGPGDGDPPYLNPPSGNSITMVLSQAIAHSFVFYERYSDPPTNTQIALDMIQIEISADGSTWHTVFYWGDGNSGNNGSLGGSYCPGTEDDNCTILSTALYNGTGITIDIDSLGYTGSYPWVRMTCPPVGSGPAPGESNDGCDIDAIQP